MTQLSVNVNKVALLRNQRDINIPSVVAAAQTCIEAGAYGVTVHPRPDERHIRESDVYDLAEIVKDVEYNIEGNPIDRYMRICRAVKPTQCTLVPDAPDQKTSDHGWDLRDASNIERLVPIVEEIQSWGSRVSIFMDPEPDLMAAAKQTGADRVELYTEPYATAFREGRGEEEVKRYAEAAAAAQEQGLGVNAGHDLNLKNLGFFLERVPGVLEVSIGHALIAEALFMGLKNTVEAYLRILGPASE